MPINCDQFLTIKTYADLYGSMRGGLIRKDQRRFLLIGIDPHRSAKNFIDPYFLSVYACTSVRLTVESTAWALWYMESWNHMAHGPCIHEYFDNQSVSICCVGKLGHLFGFLWHYRHYLLRNLKEFDDNSTTSHRFVWTRKRKITCGPEELCSSPSRYASSLC